jgi:hypothetical protein
MKVSIMTCEDRTEYLNTLIQQLDGQGIEYDIWYQGKTCPSGMICVDKPHDNAWKNSQFNYGQILSNSENEIILEDDVKICENFEARANEYLAGLEERYAVALYACYGWAQDSKLAQYPLHNFYGTQGMVYDKQTRIGFGKYLLDNIGRDPYDLALKKYITEQDTDIVLYATTKSLVQHMGVNTTGLGYHHQAFNFIDDSI